MKRSNYPYPVLGNGDDVDGSFEVSLERSSSIDEGHVLHFRIVLEHAQLAHMVDNGTAQYVVEILCSRSFYREVLVSSSQALTARIPVSELRGRVDIGVWVASCVKDDNYRVFGAHPEFGDEAFSISVGEILAVDAGWTFYVDPLFDPLRDTAASFIKINENPEQDRDVLVDYASQDLVILLSPSAYADYMSVRNFSADSIHAALVLPVLVDAIYQLKAGELGFADRRWQERLAAMISARQLNDQSALEVAQLLLGAPVGRGLQDLASKYLFDQMDIDLNVEGDRDA